MHEEKKEIPVRGASEAGKSRSALAVIWSVFTWIIVAAAVLLAVGLVGVRLAGIQVFTVLSGSMEPAYKTGSVIYVKKADYTALRPGDVITFMVDEHTIATHRIVDIIPDEDDPTVLRFATKGDANAQPDANLVHYKNIIGTPVFTVPGLGYVVNYIQNPPGTYVAIAAGVIVLLLVFLPDMFDDSKKKAPKENGEGEAQ